MIYIQVLDVPYCVAQVCMIYLHLWHRIHIFAGSSLHLIQKTYFLCHLFSPEQKKKIYERRKCYIECDANSKYLHHLGQQQTLNLHYPNHQQFSHWLLVLSYRRELKLLYVRRFFQCGLYSVHFVHVRLESAMKATPNCLHCK